VTQWREATWEEERDELAAHLVFLQRTLREAGHFPEGIDPDEHSMRLTFNYLSTLLEHGHSFDEQKVRRVLRLPHDPAPLTRH
jgi:hypothetical protein